MSSEQAVKARVENWGWHCKAGNSVLAPFNKWKTRCKSSFNAAHEPMTKIRLNQHRLMLVILYSPVYFLSQERIQRHDSPSDFYDSLQAVHVSIPVVVIPSSALGNPIQLLSPFIDGEPYLSVRHKSYCCNSSIGNTICVIRPLKSGIYDTDSLQHVFSVRNESSSPCIITIYVTDMHRNMWKRAGSFMTTENQPESLGRTGRLGSMMCINEVKSDKVASLEMLNMNLT